MQPKSVSELSDTELINEAKLLKSFSITNAFFVGFFAAVLFYSFIKNSWGLVSLIPLFFIYKLANDPKNKRKKEVEAALKQRNLA